MTIATKRIKGKNGITTFQILCISGPPVWMSFSEASEAYGMSDSTLRRGISKFSTFQELVIDFQARKKKLINHIIEDDREIPGLFDGCDLLTIRKMEAGVSLIQRVKGFDF
jgi:hypothetical protein